MPKESCMLNEVIMEIAMKTLRIILTTLVLSIITACGGGGGATTGSISGTVTKGPLSNATVTAYAINNGQRGTQIATATTAANGSFTMTMGSYAGPVMLQVSGGSYTDEANGTPMTMAPGDVMTAVMPNIAAGAAISGIQVTPVTAMAQSMAQHMTGGMTDANITAANTAMGNYFLVTTGILTTQPINPLIPGSGTAVGITQDMKNYGLTIAAMSQSAKTLNMTASSAFVTAMMSDASDGVMNGKMGNTSVSMTMGGMMGGGMGMMAATAGWSSLATAMTTFLSPGTTNVSGLTMTDMTTLTTKLTNSNGQI